MWCLESPLARRRVSPIRQLVGRVLHGMMQALQRGIFPLVEHSGNVLSRAHMQGTRAAIAIVDADACRPLAPGDTVEFRSCGAPHGPAKRFSSQSQRVIEPFRCGFRDHPVRDSGSLITPCATPMRTRIVRRQRQRRVRIKSASSYSTSCEGRKMEPHQIQYKGLPPRSQPPKQAKEVCIAMVKEQGSQ